MRQANTERGASMSTKQQSKDDARTYLAHVATELATANDNMHAAVVDAVAAGVPQSEVARIVGVNRATVYRWLKESGYIG